MTQLLRYYIRMGYTRKSNCALAPYTAAVTVGIQDPATRSSSTDRPGTGIGLHLTMCKPTPTTTLQRTQLIVCVTHKASLG